MAIENSMQQDPEMIQPIDSAQFAQQEPQPLYSQMRPDQRAAIAGEFHRLLLLAGDPNADRLLSGSPGAVTPEVATQIHTYTQQHHPEIFGEVMHHPVTVAALEAPGVKPPEAEDANADLKGVATGVNDKPAERPTTNLLP